MQTQPPIRLQAVEQLAKCQGVPVVVQLLALARPMALQEQAAAILQVILSKPSYCIVKRYRDRLVILRVTHHSCMNVPQDVI